MQWHLSDTDVPKRVVLFSSKEDHCVADLLYRWRAGELECDITCVIANHEDLRGFVEWHGVPSGSSLSARSPRPKPARSKRWRRSSRRSRPT